MKITRFNPSLNLGRVADFDQWVRNPFAAFPLMGQLLGDFAPAFTSGRPATDVHEDKDNYYARFELPGVKKEDLKVEIHDRLLNVSAERKEKNGEQESSFTLCRSISVPEGVNAEGISARLEDGILVVTLPKQEHRKPKLIEIA
ncbi:MAG TPA: heat-shock protein Hsp20 [Verrucomicrobiales bacterium]|nr:heat-shock protein Hsp20 [Verrucomicrobiales bacterium]HRJ09332.1 Hsp20/alpha crystallin family protein [Prosthecobacter sp.]HRK15709.1 Hsp20/alpha crystallin family protein [Prosthecobacter sp.]